MYDKKNETRVQNSKTIKEYDMYIKLKFYKFKFLGNLIVHYDIRTFWLRSRVHVISLCFFICIHEYVATYEESVKKHNMYTELKSYTL